MKRSSTIFLQTVVVLVGIGALVFMLWEPHIEGRNVNATVFEIYFKDPFLAVAYTASIAFFVALYKTFKVLSLVRENKTFSTATAKALRTIKYCGRILIAFAFAGEAYLFIARPEEDIAGGVFMGLIMIAISGTIASVAARFEQKLQNALDKKSV